MPISSSSKHKKTQTERLWKQLITWPVVSFFIAVAIGIGVGVLSMTPPDFIIAKACFVSASVMLLAKVVHWLISAKAGRVERMILSFFIFGVVGAGLVEALHWVKNREQLASASHLASPQTLPKPNIEAAPTPTPTPTHTPVVADKTINHKPPLANKPRSERSRRRTPSPNDTEDILYGRKKGPDIN